MNLERACVRADSVRGPRSAARLYNDIEYELALGEPSDRLEVIGEQALALLEGRFRGVQEAARRIEEPPQLSRRAGGAVHIGRRTALPPAAASRRGQCEPARRDQSRWRTYADPHRLFWLALTVVVLVVIVNFWAYIVLGMVALAAIADLRG